MPGRGFAAFVVAGVRLCLRFAAAGMDRPCIEGDEGNNELFVLRREGDAWRIHRYLFATSLVRS